MMNDNKLWSWLSCLCLWFLSPFGLRTSPRLFYIISLTSLL